VLMSVTVAVEDTLVVPVDIMLVIVSTALKDCKLVGPLGCMVVAHRPVQITQR